MGKQIVIDDSYFLQGVIPLYRGDDWFLSGKIKQIINGDYFQDVNLAGVSLTAYFPADPSVTSLGVIPGQVIVDRADCGSIQILLPAASSPLVLTGQSDIYVIAQPAPSGPTTTYFTQNQPAHIQDRTFQTF